MSRASHARDVLSLVAAVVLFGASTTEAALTTESCLAQKRLAHGILQKCRAVEEGKTLLGKPADLGKCTTTFQEKVAKLSQKASDAGISCRYADNGDGTVSDYDTGLMWEKKNDADGAVNLLNRHDVDNIYTWNTTYGGTTPNGTAFMDFLDELNDCTSSNWTTVTGGFAGHCDWRLPTIIELQTLVSEPYPCGSTPCIDAIFGPTATYYWSSTTFAYNPAIALNVNFSGIPEGSQKHNSLYVRAVRGGL